MGVLSEFIRIYLICCYLLFFSDDPTEKFEIKSLPGQWRYVCKVEVGFRYRGELILNDAVLQSRDESFGGIPASNGG